MKQIGCGNLQLSNLQLSYLQPACQLSATINCFIHNCYKVSVEVAMFKGVFLSLAVFLCAAPVSALSPREQSFGTAFEDGYRDATIDRLERLITTAYERLAAESRGCGHNCAKSDAQRESALRKKLGRYETIARKIRRAHALSAGVTADHINIREAKSGRIVLSTAANSKISLDPQKLGVKEPAIEVVFRGADPDLLHFMIDGRDLDHDEKESPWFVTGDPGSGKYDPLSLSAGRHTITFVPRNSSGGAMGARFNLTVDLAADIPVSSSSGGGSSSASAVCGDAPQRADKMDSSDWTVITGGKRHLRGKYKNVILKGGGVASVQNDVAAFIVDDGTTLENVIVTGTKGVGLAIGGDKSAVNVVLKNVVAYDNGGAGIGGKARHLTMCWTKSYNNNKRLQKSDGGGGKFTRSVDLHIEGHEAYDNNGPGMWFDNYNYGIVITNSSFHDNHSKGNKFGGSGLDFEIGGSARDKGGGTGSICWDDQHWLTKPGLCGTIQVDHSTFSGNDANGVQVYATYNVRLRHNLFQGDDVYLKDGGRGLYKVQDLIIRDNTFTGSGSIVADGATKKGCSSENLDIGSNDFEDGSGWSCH